LPRKRSRGGRIIAVQVKSGSSWFAAGSDTSVSFHPPQRHRSYWARYPLPVILVLHEEGVRTVWADAREQLRNGADRITVPYANHFDSAGVLRALGSTGPLPETRRSPRETLTEMASFRHNHPQFRVSFLDLFLGGLTAIAHTLYFGVDLAWETQDVIAALPGEQGRVNLGPAEYAFFDDYLAYVVSRDLARVDFDAWRGMAERFGMTADLISLLTRAGEELVGYLHEEFGDLTAQGLTRERSVRFDMYDIDTRVPLQIELARRLGSGDLPGRSDQGPLQTSEGSER
jgi:hypothetical protein